MAKRKKKNAITLGSLALALVVLIGIYFWYDNYQKSKQNTTDSVEEQTIDLATVDTTQVDSIHYVKGDTDLTFVLKDDVWVEQKDEERPINQEHIISILNAIKELKADRLIMESPEDLSDLDWISHRQY